MCICIMYQIQSLTRICECYNILVNTWLLFYLISLGFIGKFSGQSTIPHLLFLIGP